MIKSIFALIPARGGSKRLPGKNLRLLAGVSLLGRAIRQAAVLPVSVASFYAPLSVVASIPNTQSAVGSMHVGNWPTVQAVGVASWFTGAGVVASVAGRPNVVGSVHVGNWPTVQPVSVASFYAPLKVEASVPGYPGVVVTLPQVSKVSVASWYALGQVVASTVGTIFAVVNTTATGTINAVVNTQATVNVTGTLYAVVNTGAVGTQYAVVGGSLNIVGNVLASMPNVVSVGVASLPHVRPYTLGSQWSAVARIQASVANAAAVPARGAGLYNYVSALSVVNAAASYGGPVNLCDGTATLWTGYAAAAGGGVAVAFPQALKPAANATLFIAVPVASLDLYVSISGFRGP